MNKHGIRWNQSNNRITKPQSVSRTKELREPRQPRFIVLLDEGTSDPEAPPLGKVRFACIMFTVIFKYTWNQGSLFQFFPSTDLAGKYIKKVYIS